MEAPPQAVPELPAIGAPPLPADFVLEDYQSEMARVPVAFIRRATGLSYSYCKLIRRGKIVPHVAHWAALRALKAVGCTRC